MSEVVLDLRGYEVLATNTFLKKSKKLSKKHPFLTESLENFRVLITRIDEQGRGIKSKLRYTINLEGISLPVYYTRWTTGDKVGKSSGLRIWYCKFERKAVLCLLQLYKHNENIDDIKRHQAEQYVQEALRLVQTVPD